MMRSHAGAAYQPRRARGTAGLALGAAIALSLSLASPAHAAEEADERPSNGNAAGDAEGDEATALDTVTVQAPALGAHGPVGGYAAERSATATRMDLPLDEQPSQTQVISSEIIEDTGSNRVEEALDFSAGVQRSNTFGNTSDGLRIRGFDATIAEDGAVSDGAVANITAQRDSSFVERVEVLRGPASALYGEGSPGGVINLVTKRPRRGTFARGETSVSSFERYRQTFDLNTTAGRADRVRMRVSGAVEAFDSFREEIDGDRQAVAPAITYAPNDRVELRYRASYQRDSQPFDRGIPIGPNGSPRSQDDRFFGDPDDGDTETETIRQQLEAEIDLADGWTGRLFGGLTHNTLEGRASEPLLLSPISLPANVLGVPVQANDTIFRSTRERDQESTIWTGRGEVVGRFETAGVNHRALLSIEGRQIEDDRDFAQTPVFGSPDLVNVSDGVIDTPEQEPMARSDQLDEVTNVGFMAFDRIKPVNSLSILAGGRFDVIDQTSKVTTNTGSSSTKLDESEFSPTVGAVFNPVSWGSVFVRYAQSFEVNTANGPDGSPIAPQEGETIEGGVRFEAPGRELQATITAFDTDLENVPIADAFTDFSLATDQESRGIEVSMQGEITDNLSMIANYTYTDGEVTDIPNLEGNADLQGVPEHAANLFGKYAFDRGTLRGLSLTGGLVFEDERANSVPRLQPTPGGLDPVVLGGKTLDSYVRLDLGVGYRIRDWVEASFQVKNITNVDYERASTPDFALPQPPRTAIGRVSLRF